MAALKVLYAACLLSVVSCNLLAQQKPSVDKENPFCMDGHVAPSVFLMGYQKSGSTSLWNDLRDNYHLATAKPIEGEDSFRNKEVSYFSNDQRYAKGKNFYLKHWPACSELKTGKAIDASPNTIFGGEKTAKRVKDFYGEKAKELKFIVIVRDPTERMESSYWHFNAGVENNFDNYVAKTIEKAKTWAKEDGDAPEPNFYYPNMYIKHLKPWLEEFSPEQFAFMTLSQYDNEHGAAMRHLSRRLKIYGNANAGVYQDHKREHPDMKASTKKMLDKFYAPYMKELEELVQKSKIGMGDNPVRKMMQKSSSLLQVSSATQSSYMDAGVDEALRLEHGTYAPLITEQELNAEVDEEIGGPMDFADTLAISPIDIGFELHGNAAQP